ncbi:hypothetical protein DFJ74DRAFT_644532 [Hyaloraphidium curvatum]|nr:hypothetical protein DFJ74DRAFT_644532 [Hyaloraphidium curvatum]
MSGLRGAPAEPPRRSRWRGPEQPIPGQRTRASPSSRWPRRPSSHTAGAVPHMLGIGGTAAVGGVSRRVHPLSSLSGGPSPLAAVDSPPSTAYSPSPSPPLPSSPRKLLLTGVDPQSGARPARPPTREHAARRAASGVPLYERNAAAEGPPTKSLLRKEAMAFALGAFHRGHPLPAGDPTRLAALGRLFTLLAASPVLTLREFGEIQPAWIRSRTRPTS